MPNTVNNFYVMKYFFKILFQNNIKQIIFTSVSLLSCLFASTNISPFGRSPQLRIHFTVVKKIIVFFIYLFDTVLSTVQSPNNSATKCNKA